MNIFMGFGPGANFSQTTETRKCIILYGKQVDKSKFRTFPVCTDNQLILLVTGSILTGAFLRLVHFWWRVFQVSVILKGWNGCKMNEIENSTR